eukprot:4070091-Ditylum_brightwellii.AAC.1
MGCSCSKDTVSRSTAEANDTPIAQSQPTPSTNSLIQTTKTIDTCNAITSSINAGNSKSAVKSSVITNAERDDNKTAIEVKLNAETKANLENLQGLTRTRNAMLANAKK